MPLSKYYNGGGEKVMGSMKKEYGAKKAKQVFYATANKMGVAPDKNTKKKMGVK